MKVVVAIDSFKGCATSYELANSIKDGVKKVYPDSLVEILPIADGGEGTLEAFSHSYGSVLKSLTCKDPLQNDIQASYVILQDKTAVIEMASASGLPLVPLEKRDPSIASTYGTGELIKDAIKEGCRNFIVGIGGSATNDAGLGMLRALGYRFLDEKNQEVTFAKDLSKIKYIDESEVLQSLHECNFQIACDVNNPLYGPNGAAYVYAKQKGANEVMIEFLDKELYAFAKTVALHIGKDLSLKEGAGAAGGLGFGFLAFLNAQLKSGIQIVLDEVGFEEKIKDATFVITGEGRIDNQSVMGKVIDGIAKICKKESVPCIALCGSYDIDEQVHECGVSAVFSIQNAPISLEVAMQKEVALNLTCKKAEQIFRLVKSTS